MRSQPTKIEKDKKQTSKGIFKRKHQEVLSEILIPTFEGLIKGWKKRFFRLYDSEGVLSYFKSEKDFQEIGSIDLKGGFAVEKTTDKPNGFAITMKV